MNPDVLVDALDRIHGAIEPDDLAAGFDAATAAVVDVLPTCCWASITVLDRDRPDTIAYDGATALDVDTAQYDEGDGPCITAARDAVEVDVADVEADDRWPVFRAAALRVGVRSTFSLPLGDERLRGGLNLYADHAHGFDDDALRTAARTLAGHVSIAVRRAVALREAHELTEQLEAGLATRDVIGQAKGILMASRKVTATQAFHLLRAESQRRNLKVRDLAVEVAEAGELV